MNLTQEKCRRKKKERKEKKCTHLTLETSGGGIFPFHSNNAHRNEAHSQMLRCLVISARVLNELVSVNARQWSGVNGGGEGGLCSFFLPKATG